METRVAIENMMKVIDCCDVDAASLMSYRLAVMTLVSCALSINNTVSYCPDMCLIKIFDSE